MRWEFKDKEPDDLGWVNVDIHCDVGYIVAAYNVDTNSLEDFGFTYYGDSHPKVLAEAKTQWETFRKINPLTAD